MIDVLEQSATAVAITGTTDERGVGDCLIPGKVLGLNGELRINVAYAHTGGASIKTFRIYLGGTLIFTDAEAAGNLEHSTTLRVRAKNSHAAQLVSVPSEFTASGQNNDNSDVAINLAVDQQLTMTAQLANGSDTFTMRAFSIEFLRSGP